MNNISEMLCGGFMGEDCIAMSSESIKQQYTNEAHKRWGETEAYKESERRTANYSQSDWDALYDGIDAIMKGFAELKTDGASPDSEQSRRQVEKLRQFITGNMYTCTDEILAGLGQMYVADERFKKNIDKHGEGTAAYISECIKSYLNRK
jgi:uncharacterized protein YdaT